MLLLHIFTLLVEHGSATAFLRLMCQAVPLPLYELLFESLKEKPIEANHVLDLLLLFIHHLQAGQPFVSQVVARHFHGDLLVGLLHLRHVDKLAEEVLVHGEHPGALGAGTYLQLLVVEEVHFVDEAWLHVCHLLLLFLRRLTTATSRWTIGAFHRLCQCFQFH